MTAPRPTALAPTEKKDLATEADLPPVVARLVVEIRSDGTRTVARGAMEDHQTGQKVALQADASTPLALATELTKALLRVPTLTKELTKETVQALLPQALRRRLNKSRPPR